MFGDFGRGRMKGEMILPPAPPPPPGFSRAMAIFDHRKWASGMTTEGFKYKIPTGPAWQIGQSVLQSCPGLQESLLQRGPGPIVSNDPIVSCLQARYPGEYYLKKIGHGPGGTFSGFGQFGGGMFAPLVPFLFYKPTTPTGGAPQQVPGAPAASTAKPQGVTKESLTASERSVYDMLNGSAKDGFLKHVAKQRGLGGYNIRRPGFLTDFS